MTFRGWTLEPDDPIIEFDCSQAIAAIPRRTSESGHYGDRPVTPCAQGNTWR